MTQPANQNLSTASRQAAGAALACHDACRETITYCRERGGSYADEAELRAMEECAALCKETADGVLASHEPRRPCNETAELCARVAQFCARFADDARMQSCAEACLRAASLCKQLAAPTQVNYDKIVADSFPASDLPPVPAQS